MSGNDVTKRWYLRTHADGDTHRGILADTGIVTTDPQRQDTPRWSAAPHWAPRVA